jgi:hypothetical protein
MEWVDMEQIERLHEDLLDLSGRLRAMAVAEWESIAPGRNPGGLWVRITGGATVMSEHCLVVDDAEKDQGIASLVAAAVGESRVYIYDGDTGVCVNTIIVTGDARSS